MFDVTISNSDNTVVSLASTHSQVSAQVVNFATQMESAHSQVSAQALFTQNMWLVPTIAGCKHTEQKRYIAISRDLLSSKPVGLASCL